MGHSIEAIRSTMIQRRRNSLAWVVVLVGFTVLYLSFPSRQYDLDTLPEIEIVSQGQVVSSDPAHLLYPRLGLLAYRIWLRAGGTGDAMTSMVAMNALFGGAAVTLLWLCLQRTLRNGVLALCMASLWGLSYGFWTHTADAFFIIPAAFLGLLALFLVIGNSKSPRSLLRAGAGGVVFGLAILCYQGNAFLAPGLVAAMCVGANDRRKLFADIGVFCVAAGCIAMVGWVLVGFGQAHVQSISEFLDWLVLSHGGMTRGLWRRDGVNVPLASATAWVATLVPIYEGLRLRELARGQITPDRIVSQLTLFGLFIFGALSAAMVLRSVRRLKHESRQHVVFWLLWFAVPGLATAWFDPAEIKLWIIPLAGMLAVAGLGCTSQLSTMSRSANTAFHCFLVTLVAGIGLSTWTLAVRPNSIRENPGIQSARRAGEHMTEYDVLLSATFDWSGYLSHFSGRRSFSLVGAAQRLKESDSGGIVDILDSVISDTAKRGGRVYILNYFEPMTLPIWEAQITPNTGLIRATFDAYGLRRAWLVSETEWVWEVCPDECR